MKIEIDTTQMSANEFGEVMRKYFFIKGKGYGCYENFEVESFMVRGKLTPEVQSDYFGDDSDNYHCFRKIDNSNIFIAWHWDGDGTLVVSDGDRVAINFDCKKSRGWEFINV